MELQHVLYMRTTDDDSVAIPFQKIFGQRLMTARDEESILSRLVSNTSHPSLSPGHRLLSFHCLLNFPDSASATLMGCLVSLQKSIHYGIAGRSAITLYRVLFLYFQRHHDTVIKQDIFKMIVTIVTEQPKFVPHTINFIERVNRISADSFPVELLRCSMESIVSTPPMKVLEDLQFHLVLLERVCQEATIQAKPVVKFLHQLLHSTPLEVNGSWLLGNCILSVCHSIMQHHDTADIFQEFGELLFELSTSYSDLDIRDRARFYYAMLTNISSQKISSILSSAGTTHSLTRLVTGSSNFDIPSPVQKLHQPILCLTRIQRRPVHKIVPFTSCSQYLSDLKENIEQPLIHFDYHLHFITESGLKSQLERLHTLILHVESPQNYKDIPDVSLSRLTLDESKESPDNYPVISLKIQPLQPVPSTLQVSAMFTADGEPFTCSLSPVIIQFSDLFLTLPVTSTSRSKLFYDLWLDIEEQSSGLCAKSVCTLLLDKTAIKEVLQAKLQDYRIDPYENDDESQDQVGILLPPFWHVLLKMTTNSEETVVAIATDNWKILPLINTFLHELEENGTR